jgi:C4-dicarboxylate transporter DctM subunit
LILGGIYLGWFTPTEVAAVSAGYCLLIAYFLYRHMSLRDVGSSFKRALYQSGMIYFIIIGGNLLAFMLTRLGVTQMMVAAVKEAGLQPWQFLLIVNIILLGLGCVLDGISICILSIPIIFPMADAVGVNLIHFSVVMTANIEIATLTPPIGLNLFVMSGVTGLPVHEVVRGVSPFFAMRFCMLMVITYVPWLSMILPTLGGYM